MKEAERKSKIKPSERRTRSSVLLKSPKREGRIDFLSRGRQKMGRTALPAVKEVQAAGVLLKKALLRYGPLHMQLLYVSGRFYVTTWKKD